MDLNYRQIKDWRSKGSLCCRQIPNHFRCIRARIFREGKVHSRNQGHGLQIDLGVKLWACIKLLQGLLPEDKVNEYISKVVNLKLEFSEF